VQQARAVHTAALDDPAPGSTAFHITVFEPSYQERGGWSGQEHGWLWATG